MYKNLFEKFNVNTITTARIYSYYRFKKMSNV